MSSKSQTELLFYTHASLDRAHLVRENPDKIKKFLLLKETKFIAHWHNQSFFKRIHQTSEPLSFDFNLVKNLEHVITFFAGFLKDQPVFGIDLSHLEEHDLNALITEGNREDIRVLASTLSNRDASLMHMYGACFHGTTTINSVANVDRLQ